MRFDKTTLKKIMVATTNAIAKVAAVVAGLGLVAMSFASFAPAAKAAMTAEQIAAQIAALQAELAGMGGSSASATFTMDLTLGSSGAEVTALQNWLISKGYAIPAGATGYFGAQTQSALAAWQAANGITPAAGYFGPITRAKVNSMAGGSTGGSTGNTGGLSGGEASLEDFDGQDGEDDQLTEGGTAKVAEFEFDVEDGDVSIERVDLTFETTATGSEEDEPWNTFDTITLYVNGEEVASEDVSEEDDWLEDTEPFTFRFSGIDAVVEEGETATVEVEIEAQNSIDSADTTIPWTVEILDEDLRAIDGEGIDQYTGDSTGEEVSFDVVEEGEDDGLDVRSSTEDPDAATLKVEDDSRSDWYTIFVYDLEADEDGGGIELNTVPVSFTVSDDNVNDVVNDVKLVIDGEEFDDFDWVSPTGTSASTTFDIDGDYTVDAGDRVAVEVMVEFKAMTAYSGGTTIIASTSGEYYDAEGADDVTVDGSATSETHTLQVEGINVEPTSDSSDIQVVDGVDNDYATYTIEVEVTAFESDIFIPNNSSSFTYQFENAGTGAAFATTSATTSQAVTSSADVVGNFYRVNEGDTETFTYTFTLDPQAAAEGVQYRAQLLTINYNDTQAAPDAVYTATPANDYETDSELIAD